MTPERKKALLLISATFIVGVLIGALGMGLIIKQMHKPSASSQLDRKEAVIQKIVDVVEASPSLAGQMRPYILDTIAQIDSLQEHTNQEVDAALIKFQENMKPMLNEQQLEKLREFHRKTTERRAQERKK